jgi:carboxyl-terminal processing protease
MEIAKGTLVLGSTALVLTTVAITGAGLNFHKGEAEAVFKDSPKEIIDEVWQIVDRQFVDGTFNQVDWRKARNRYLSRSYKDKKEAYKAIRDMLKPLNDPYTRFMDPKEYRDLQIDTSGQLTGVGIQLAQDEKTKKLVVISPIEDTPAAEAGIIAKDTIIEINGKSTKGMDVNQAVQLIRGKEGTEVILKIMRGKKLLTFPLKRARIEIHPVKYTYRTEQGLPLGYIRLNQFSANAPDEMKAAITALEKRQVKGYILDLRSNPGGLLYSGIEIARMWMKEGVIVSTADRQGVKDKQSANRTALTDKPLVVLVDGGSASASEILSGALQDNKRGVLVGTKTFGKGLVQSVRPLGDGSGLAVTIAKYFTPNGTDINHKGIIPNIKVDLTEKQKEALVKNRDQIGTGADPQYAKALQTLKQEVAKLGDRATSNAPQ